LTKDDFQDGILEDSAPTMQKPPDAEILRGILVTWQKRELGKYTVWVARAK